MTFEKALAMVKADPEGAAKALCDLSEMVESLRQTVKALEREVAKLSKNSSNSSKPPSSDITKPKRKPHNSGKEGEKRKKGGQPGHPKHERPPFREEEIDKPYDYVLDHCPDCGGEVRLIEGAPNVLQQMEIKEIVVVKEEHRSYPVLCEKCKQVHYMELPAEVVEAGLFKERITALVAYMKCVCHASYSTIRKFIRDVLGEKVSRGYLAKVIQKVSRSLDGPYQELLDLIPLETTVNVDETGHKENGENFWTWVFKAELYVLFKIDKSRGSKVLIDVLGEQFKGVIGSDYFSAYRKYMKDFHVLIQFCIAHLIRDLRFLVGLPDAETREYGRKLLDAVKEMFRVIHDRDNMSKCAFKAALEESRRTIIRIGCRDAPSRLGKDGKEEKREAQNMAERFRKHGDAYFQFITTPAIGPTNNAAERALRFIVMDRHVTQGTRSAQGRQANERLRRVIGACLLQGPSAFEFILTAVKAYFHGAPAPSLLPDRG